jgi:carboxyl-terminal processing protease
MARQRRRHFGSCATRPFRKSRSTGRRPRPGVVARLYIREVTIADLVRSAVRGLYRRVDADVPGPIEERLKSPDLTQDTLARLLADVRQDLGRREDLDHHHDVDLALAGMLADRDPYSVYLDPEAAARFRWQTTRGTGSPGARIRRHIPRDAIEIATPMRGGPAHRYGVRAGDLITSITVTEDEDGHPLDRPRVVSTEGLSLTDATRLLLGPPGTSVRMTIARPGVTKPLEMELAREVVELETVLGVRRDKDDAWDYRLEPDRQIGYVRLSSFTLYTARDLDRVLTDLVRQDIRGLVLDLRSTPGGLLNGCLRTAELFLDGGPIATFHPRVGEEEHFEAQPGGRYRTLPLVCLVNRGTASSAELLAACLQDRGRAIVIGERTYGKGSVQESHAFNGGVLKFTIGTLHRPNGKNLDRRTAPRGSDWGVTPNAGFECILSRAQRQALAERQYTQVILGPEARTPPPAPDPQLAMALEYLRGR